MWPGRLKHLVHVSRGGGGYRRRILFPMLIEGARHGQELADALPPIPAEMAHDPQHILVERKVVGDVGAAGDRTRHVGDENG